jgi:hypothetical protein
VTEAELQRSVVALAMTCGYDVMHHHDSRRSRPGWPDLAIWRPGRFLMAELKTEKGRFRPEQESTIASLREAGIEVFTWRPSDWPDAIYAALR